MEYFISFIVNYTLAAIKDVVKVSFKAWRVKQIQKEFNLSRELAIQYFDLNYDKEMPDFFKHRNYWHITTTLIWVVGFIKDALITHDWKYLLLGIPFLFLDFMYYLLKKFILDEDYFIPDEMNWFVQESKLMKKVFGESFSRVEFLVTLIVLILSMIGIFYVL